MFIFVVKLGGGERSLKEKTSIEAMYILSYGKLVQVSMMIWNHRDPNICVWINTLGNFERWVVNELENTLPIVEKGAPVALSKCGGNSCQALRTHV